ncbi:hypothetical protein GCM10023347_19340 [Streptomyces chumphonensis]|uniref:FAD/NAD(P)-binding protein n=1 Tax=Streptomyces chumphonensis TaxID=1214925 RepID=A0A927EYP8_9ACTN|nr:FAD/NAD(P)-binding protein [Streptomyces chumphonensis]MBD3931835.1 FAD/NAD(P)-binding protein [Streptomyces chumphonensis]
MADTASLPIVVPSRPFSRDDKHRTPRTSRTARNEKPAANGHPLTACGQLVVIGGGAAATAVLHQLAKDAGFRPETVTVVDPRPVGFGLAFGTTDPKLRCNTSVDVTALHRANRSDLQCYLAARGWPVGRSDFVPRALVAHYCRERFARAQRELKARGIHMRHVAARAHTVRRAHHPADRYRITLSDGSALEATDVVVAVGGDQPLLPEVLREHADHPDLLIGPYPTERLRALPGDARVLVLGSKLSAVDAALVLCRSDRQVTLCSPFR